jgi:hypothetical protein
MIRTMVKASGNINGEFVAGGGGASVFWPDDWLAATLMSAGWSSAVTVTAATIAAVNASAGVSRFTDSGNGFGSLVVGQWIKTTNFSTAANNGYFKLTAVAAGQIDCVGATSTVTEAAGSSRTVKMGSQIVNGVAPTTYTIERAYLDTSPVTYEAFNGMMIDQFSLKTTRDEIITWTSNWMGKIGTGSDTSIGATFTGGDAGGEYKAANTNETLEAVDHVLSIFEGSVLPTHVLGATDISWQLANNLRARTQIGTLGAISVGVGSVAITGTLQMYFSTKTEMDKFRNNTVSSITQIIKDSTNTNAYIIEFPRLKYTQGKAPAPGKDQDIFTDLNFQAYMHPTELVTIRIVRFP